MQIGFSAPSGGPLASPAALTRLAREAEAMGFGYATVSDHVVIPTNIHAKYPYTDSGEFPASSRGERHEQLTQVMFLAAKTERLRLVTSVMVVPHRPALLAAKAISTIDVLSGGRLTLGIGAGWLQEEFEALQVPDFAARGKVTDEYILAAKTLWTATLPRFEGEFVRFDAVTFEPKPAQQGRAADLGRRRERPGATPRCPARRCLVPDRHEPLLPARQPRALPRRHRQAARHGREGGARPAESRPRLSRAKIRPRGPGHRRRRGAAIVLRHAGADRGRPEGAA
jgi:alkanesulfonate monooxygenase SsuD/methylene tetrahydromethanopterin reductase-like flavin-dependent oxidoreductase (luciferase family)